MFDGIGLEIHKIIEVGDILTSLTILISLMFFIISLNKDRNLRRKQQADSVRNAAAKTIGKLDRWKEISLSMFHYTDIIFVKASEELKRDYNIEFVRNFLWMELNLVRNKTSEEILDENIETAYDGLYGYDPSVRPFFEMVLTQLKNEEDFMFKGFLSNIQSDINSFNYKKESEYQTSTLRDQLDDHALFVHNKYEKRINEILKPISGNLLKLISENDRDILAKKRNYFAIKDNSIPDIEPEHYVDRDIVYGEIVI